MSAIRGLRERDVPARGFLLVWITLTLMVLLPIWHQRLLPMLDTPNHLALIRGWHDYDDPSYHIADYYTLHIRAVPYMLFYGSVHLLMYAAPIEVANKLFLSAYAILFPLSMLKLARSLGRSPWLAVGAFALVFNRNFVFGFSSYLMAVVCLFFAFGALVDYLRAGRRRDLLGLAGTSLLTYFGHVLVWFVLGLGVIALFWLHRRLWRRCLYVSLACAPSVALAVIAYVQERADGAYLQKGSGFEAHWGALPRDWLDFPSWAMELFPGNFDMFVLGTLTVATLVLCFRYGTTMLHDSELERKQLPLLLMVIGLGYLALPQWIEKPMVWWNVSQRLAWPAVSLMLLLPAIPPGRLTRLQRLSILPVVVVCAALPVKLSWLYGDFSNRNAAFMQLVDELPRGSNVLVEGRWTGTGGPPGEGPHDASTSDPVYWHFSLWPMALHGGYGPRIFEQGTPIRPKKNFEADRSFHFDYYLVRARTDDFDREPGLRLVKRLDAWTLYRRTKSKD